MTVTLEDAILRKTRAAGAVQHSRLKTAGGEVKP